ncbi:hypothetical protein TNCV_582231 [Trichonephila clavipes]|nr:hypothetical protein TNCV_582231 [Trichonephila clavipes]
MVAGRDPKYEVQIPDLARSTQHFTPSRINKMSTRLSWESNTMGFASPGQNILLIHLSAQDHGVAESHRQAQRDYSRQHGEDKSSDEAHFWLNGYINKQNCRIWSEANPQVYVETPLHPEKLTVWCALWAGGILLQKR